jgi:transcriptional regulator with XRE-family HTH domain
MAKSKSGSKLGYGHGTGIPNPVDVHVGARLRQRRTLLGMNQTKLGSSIGLTFQQVQKYEKGTNRISASRLYALSGTLDVPVEYFFSDMPTAVAASSPTLGRGRAKKAPSYEPDPMATRETLELVRAYYKIEDANARNRLRELTNALGAAVSKDS